MLVFCRYTVVYNYTGWPRNNGTVDTVDFMCVCLCVCVCVMFMQATFPLMDQLHIHYTIIGLDPEGGQWLFKFKSNHNNKKIDKTQNSICGTVVKNETVNIRIRILLLALKMKWSVQCSASDYTIHRYTPLNSMELRTLLSLRKSFSQCTKSFTPEFGDSLTSVASVTRAHSNVFCFH